MDKEKQIKEMAKDLCNSTMCDLDTYNSCRKPRGNCSRCQRVAEDLYNTGYRKQEWISVEDRLPESYGEVLCVTRGGSVMQVTYNPKYKLFNVSFDNVENAIKVDYWMPLPEAPKMKGGAE